MEKWKRSESICLIESSVISHTGLHFSTYVRELLETQTLGRWKENPLSTKVENDSTNAEGGTIQSEFENLREQKTGLSVSM